MDPISISVGAVIAFGITYYFWKKGPPWKKHKPGVHAPAKKHSLSDPEYILHIRADNKFGFDPYYLQRSFDDAISEKVNKFESFIVVGPALAGKSRAVFESLKEFNPVPEVIIPSIDDIRNEDYPPPDSISRMERTIILFDDIHKYTVKPSFGHYLNEYAAKGAIIIATCRSGGDFDRLCDNMEGYMTVFGDPIEIAEISEEKAEEVAQATDKTVPESFNGNIGTIFVPLESLEKLYKEVTLTEKALLQSIKKLYDAGVYSENEIFSLDHVRRVFDKIQESKTEDDHWHILIKTLEQMCFYNIVDTEIQIEETFLQDVITTQYNSPKDMKEISQIFTNDYDALIKIAAVAFYIGNISLEKAAYKKMAIDVYRECQQLRPQNEYPEDHAITQINLGSAYNTLADVENKADNCQAAISAYCEALKVYTIDGFPVDYALTQSNLGSAYARLADVEDKLVNCREAISACHKALKVYTLDQFPMDYAMSQINLGVSYRTLAEIADRSINCREAISAYREALKVYTLDRFPMQYGTTQNNMGNAYRTLAVVEDRVLNCREAISACQRTLQVITLDRAPVDYAMAQSNLAGAYWTLAHEQNKKENCEKATAAMQEVLKIYTRDKFPVPYEMAMRNLARLIDFCEEE